MWANRDAAKFIAVNQTYRSIRSNQWNSYNIMTITTRQSFLLRLPQALTFSLCNLKPNHQASFSKSRTRSSLPSKCNNSCITTRTSGQKVFKVRESRIQVIIIMIMAKSLIIRLLIMNGRGEIRVQLWQSKICRKIGFQRLCSELILSKIVAPISSKVRWEKNRHILKLVTQWV